MTEYHQEPYVAEFAAAITEVTDGHVILDTSYFYPQGGGQPADTGELELPDGTTIAVTHTKKKNGETHHAVSDHEPLEAGMRVAARIDWKRRHRLMRMHTAAHVISAVIAQHEDALITGNQLKTTESRIDYDLDDYDQKRILAYQERVNQELAKHHEVTTQTLPRAEADEQLERLSGLKSGLPAHIQDVRIVRIGDLDAQACGGTHVKNTKEVGRVEFTKTKNKGAGNRRVYFTLS